MVRMYEVEVCGSCPGHLFLHAHALSAPCTRQRYTSHSCSDGTLSARRADPRASTGHCRGFVQTGAASISSHLPMGTLCCFIIPCFISLCRCRAHALVTAEDI